MTVACQVSSSQTHGFMHSHVAVCRGTPSLTWPCCIGLLKQSLGPIKWIKEKVPFIAGTCWHKPLDVFCLLAHMPPGRQKRILQELAIYSKTKTSIWHLVAKRRAKPSSGTTVVAAMAHAFPAGPWQREKRRCRKCSTGDTSLVVTQMCVWSTVSGRSL